MLQKVHFRLTSVAQKRCCLSSLIVLNNSGHALIYCHPESERSEIQLNNCKGIVSSTILRLLALQKARRTNRPPKLPPCVSIFSKPLELKFQIKTSISPIVSLPELPLLALDQLSANSQEEL